jgi:hypothetical protein
MRSAEAREALGDTTDLARGRVVAGARVAWDREAAVVSEAGAVAAVGDGP